MRERAATIVAVPGSKLPEPVVVRVAPSEARVIFGPIRLKLKDTLAAARGASRISTAATRDIAVKGRRRFMFFTSWL
jgi:hypothetical protein